MDESEALVLPGNHDLEAVEVGQVATSSELLHLEVGLVLSPLGVKTELSGGLGKRARPGASKQRDSELRESESLERINNSWEALQSINEDCVTVGDIDNNDHLSVIIAVVDEANSTWFNEILKTLYNYQTVFSFVLLCLLASAHLPFFNLNNN